MAGGTSSSVDDVCSSTTALMAGGEFRPITFQKTEEFQAMKFLNKTTMTMALACCTAAAVGCSQRTGYDDVRAAREDVAAEQHQTAEVQQEAAENIAEAERNEARVRHEALKPVTEGEREAIRDARQETAEARREGAEAVQEARKDTAEAQRDLQDTEARFNAEKARDAFVAQQQSKLTAASERIEALKARADNEEGATQETTGAKVEALQGAHDHAEDTLDELKSADVLKWDEHRAAVEQAFDALAKQMDQST
jgi:hypothetical protein